MAYITLNKKHFFNNLDIIAHQTKAKDKIALVLKDNAYGHGLREIATMAHEYGITKAVVRSSKEAEMVADYFEYILILADKRDIQNSKVRYTINDLRDIPLFNEGVRVELKVNSGMNRNGIEPKELREAFGLISQNNLLLEAVFTHHCCADEDREIFALQNRNFQAIKEEASALAKEFGIGPLRFHSCNSAALFESADFDEDMARVGIAAYGVLELPNNTAVSALQPILSLYAKRNSTRVVERGACVGYGASYKAREPLSVSNYDFGYGDGFLRACSNHYVTPEGVKLLGRISMDNSSFASDADKLLIFNDAKAAAKFANTISYEFLTALKSELPREILE
jgi:alanine racemase